MQSAMTDPVSYFKGEMGDIGLRGLPGTRGPMGPKVCDIHFLHIFYAKFLTCYSLIARNQTFSDYTILALSLVVSEMT